MSDFWFEYVGGIRCGWPWRGAEWQLLKAPGWIMPIKVKLIPKSPLNYFAFQDRLPEFGELQAFIVRRNDSGVTDEGLEKLRASLEGIECQFCTVPGDLLQLPEEACQVLRDIGVGASCND